MRSHPAPRSRHRTPRALALSTLAALALVAAPATRAAADEPIVLQAPPAPAFVQHNPDRLLRLPALEKVGGRVMGYRPAPLDRSHMTGETPAPVAHYQKAGTTFPAAFDLRSSGYVSPVKNQGACGDCWSFSTVASAESNALFARTGTFDFSENHQNVRHGFLIPACQGGNADMATAYQTRWGNTDGFATGLVYESDDPYSSTSATSVAGLAPRVHLQEVLALPGRASATDNTNWKYALTTYGALDVSIYADSGMASSSTSAYWNASTKSYNYTGTASANHEVTIVGWDDNYAATNFSTRPAGNGAWLIKNSWGTGWGNAGYFWVSFYDTRIGGAHVFRAPEAATNYTRAYLYDPLGQVSAIGLGSTTAYAANVFTAAAGESLRAVALNTSTVNAAYEISIYTGVSTNPATGKLEGGSVNTTGTAPFAGYHTVTLARPVALTAGQKFAIVVKFTTPNYGYPIPIEYPYAGYSTAVSAAGQSFVSSNGSTWSDLYGLVANANVNIRGYTGGGTTAAPAPLATPTVALASGANPSVAGSTVTFTATVAGSAGTPAGSVSFVDGATTLCSAVALASTSAGMQASCTTSALVAGSHAIVASFGGSSTYAAASASLTQTVSTAVAATSTTLASSLNPSNAGQNVTFTATVAGGSVAPTGTVVFKDGTTSLCAASLAAVSGKGQATCSTAALAAGSHAITASYGGSATYAASAGSLTQTVNGLKAASTTTLAAAANPILKGQTAKFTATVSGAAGNASGNVVFLDGTSPLCTAPLTLVGSTMQATCMSAAMSVGTHAMTVNYAGDTKYQASSAKLSFVVK